MAELHASGRVYQSRPGAVPRQKHYLDEQEGVPLQDVWTDIRGLQGTHAERVGYDTQKPEALLERIVQMCSRPGDLVLDAFAGSGTTAAVAARCGRRWITIDRSPPAFTVTRRRLRAQFDRGEAKPFVVLDAGPGARAGLSRSTGEVSLRARVLTAHGAETWPMGQIHGRRGPAAVVVASSAERPGREEVARWLADAEGQGMRAVEVIAWDFDPSAHEIEAASLWQLPRALAEGEDGAPRALPRLSLAVEAAEAGLIIGLSGYVRSDSQPGAPSGVEAIVEWAIDWAWDGAVFVPRWSARRERDGTMPLRGPPIAADAHAIVVEAVDATGQIVSRRAR
jgi:hypothetical protein